MKYVCYNVVRQMCSSSRDLMHRRYVLIWFVLMSSDL